MIPVLVKVEQRSPSVSPPRWDNALAAPLLWPDKLPQLVPVQPSPQLPGTVEEGKQDTKESKASFFIICVGSYLDCFEPGVTDKITVY